MMGVDMDTGIIASGVHISIFFPKEIFRNEGEMLDDN